LGAIVSVFALIVIGVVYLVEREGRPDRSEAGAATNHAGADLIAASAQAPRAPR
jgi:hypothetical protein